ALASLQDFAVTPLRIVEQARLLEAAAGSADTLGIRSGAIARQPALSLSGGNQQKVVLGRWLLSDPSLIILDEPTRGIDVAAKHDIYQMIDGLAADGVGVLFVSSELEELIAMCDRILTMSRGEIVGSFDRSSFDDRAILQAAFRETVAP
ncbi:MAG: ATP-binding cassette domain-containing protein, partial [Candidatus Limnocylindrales bacterium]